MPEGDEKDQMQATEMAGEREGGGWGQRPAPNDRKAAWAAWGCRTEIDFELFSQLNYFRVSSRRQGSPRGPHDNGATDDLS